jgi:DNA-binding transcriptional ArsR family regulator
MDRAFRGIWFPAEVYEDERLNWTDRVLLMEINSLDNDRGCFASNDYFAKFLRVSDRTVRESLARLRDLGLVTQESFDGRERVLHTTMRYGSGQTGSLVPGRPEENFHHNNTVNNPSNIPPVVVSKDTPTSPKGEDVAFDAFWAAYPRRVGKPAALRAWKALHVTALDIKPIMDGLAAHKRSEQWQRNNGQFIPHPSTWLNQRRWDGMAPDQPVNITNDVPRRSGFQRYGDGAD